MRLQDMSVMARNILIMKCIHILSRALTIALVTASLHSGLHAAASPSSGVELKKLIPISVGVHDWTIKPNSKLLTGQMIYDYMDGAGEIPLACGYQALQVAEYAGKAGGVMTVELYDMGGSADAFGLYSMKRLASGHVASIPSSGPPVQAQSGFHELLFHRGSFTVLTFGDDSGKVKDADLMALARTIASNIKEAGTYPDLLNYLPHGAYIPRSAKFFHGKAAMDTVKFVREDLFRLKSKPEVAVANYSAPAVRMMVLRYGSSSQAAEVARSAQKSSETKGMRFVVQGRVVGAVWSTLGKPIDDVVLGSLKAAIQKPGKSIEGL